MASSSFLRCFAPPSLGGMSDWASLDNEAARLGVSPDELGNKVRCRFIKRHANQLRHDRYSSTQRVR